MLLHLKTWSTIKIPGMSNKYEEQELDNTKKPSFKNNSDKYLKAT